MAFMDRVSNGWTLFKGSFKVLKENKQLIVFPLLSGLSIILIIGSLFIFGFPKGVEETDGDVESYLGGTSIFLLFGFYVINYFIVYFFNVALIHCTRLYFRGEEVSVRAGIQFAFSRIGAIFSWSLVAATVGLILKAIQENSDWIGKIITGIIGVVWNIATFFVVPVLAYENTGPIEAIKRSSKIMKENWGESLTASFSFGLFQFLAIIIIGIPLYLIGSMFDPITGIILAVTGGFLIFSIFSAAENIFISAVYHQIKGDPVKHVDQEMVKNLFESKK